MVIIPLYFDSMGAKSACVFVRTRNLNILIDPSAAALQPGFPLPDSVKTYYLEKAYGIIKKFGKISDIIIITHYHYDHHTLPSYSKDFELIYRNKTLLIKNPNVYINRSQHERARIFLEQLFKFVIGYGINDYYSEPVDMDIVDPEEWIPIAISKDFGDYNSRRKQILSAGKKMFENLKKLWLSTNWIREVKGSTRVLFADAKQFTFNGVKIRFTKPMFHGLEYDRLGWVIGVVIESEGKKFLYSSDIQGPMIEDYAEWIINENPDYIVIDGPPTYQFGYLMNRINLNRAKENISKIIETIDPTWLIYDHHLLRDIRWESIMKDVLERAKKLNRNLITASELNNQPPVASVVRMIKKEKRLDCINKLGIPQELEKDLIAFF